MIVPSLLAPNLSETMGFYEGVLGFQKTGEYPGGGEPAWCEVSMETNRGLVRLWFFSDPIKGRPAPALSGTIYILVDDVNALAKRLTGKTDLLWGPEDQDYGLREFGVEDPNGYILAFAQEI